MHSLEECLRSTRWTHLLISKSFQLCNQVLGIQGKHRALNSNPTSSCIHPWTHNQLFPETVYLGPSKRICYTSYGNTPELPPQYWVMSGLYCHQPHRRVFDVGRLKYSRTAAIDLWRQHLGAQLPGTLPQPLNDRRHREQCSRHKDIGTIQTILAWS